MNAERERRRSKIEIVVVGFVVFMICFEKWCPKKLPLKYNNTKVTQIQKKTMKLALTQPYTHT